MYEDLVTLFTDDASRKELPELFSTDAEARKAAYALFRFHSKSATKFNSLFALDGVRCRRILNSEM